MGKREGEAETERELFLALCIMLFVICILRASLG